MAKPDIEKRVGALEEAMAQGLYGGTKEEAMEKWEAEHLGVKKETVEDHPPPIPSPGSQQADTTLHKAKTANTTTKK